MKGHTKIELTDSKGNVETYEDDNMITTALQQMFCTFGSWECALDSNVFTNTIWKSLLGGILLFDKNLTEDENQIFPCVDGMKMVGNGAIDITNGSDVTELGSWNSTESGVQDDGSIKLVYDFTTAQANGTIRSVALTSKQGGYIGYGNATSNTSVKDLTIAKSFFGYLTGSYNLKYIINSPTGASCGNTPAAAYLMYADYEQDAVFCLDPINLADKNGSEYWKSSGKIKINKYRAGFKNVSIKDNNCLTLVDTIYVDVPSFETLKSYVGSGTYINTTFNNGYTYLIFTKSTSYGVTISNGASFYVLELDRVTSDGEVKATLFKVTNTTGESIYPGYYSVNIDGKSSTYDNGFVAVDERKNMFFKNNSQDKIYKINLRDSTDVSLFSSNSSSFRLLNDNYFYVNNVGLLDSSGVGGPVNNTMQSYEYNFTPIKIVGQQGFKIYAYDYCDKMYLRPYLHAGYLATINNLATPVVKTSDKTMKVTYTLTFNE